MSIKDSVTALFIGKNEAEPNIVERYLAPERDAHTTTNNMDNINIVLQHSTNINTTSSQIFICKGKKVLAKGLLNKDGNFIVLKDSRVSKLTKLKNNNKRDDLLKTNHLIEDSQHPDSFILAEDITFTSPMHHHFVLDIILVVCKLGKARVMGLF